MAQVDHGYVEYKLPLMAKPFLQASFLSVVWWLRKSALLLPCHGCHGHSGFGKLAVDSATAECMLDLNHKLTESSLWSAVISGLCMHRRMATSTETFPGAG